MFSKWKPFILIAALLALGVGAWVVVKRKKAVTPSPTVATPTTQSEVVADIPESTPLLNASAIYLFGNFEVFDSATHDVTTSLRRC